MDDRRQDIRNAIEAMEHPRRYWLKATVWRGAIVPAARGVWRFIVAAAPLWAALTALATAFMAFKEIGRP